MTIAPPTWPLQELRLLGLHHKDRPHSLRHLLQGALQQARHQVKGAPRQRGAPQGTYSTKESGSTPSKSKGAGNAPSNTKESKFDDFITNGKPGVITVVTDNANIRQFAEMNAPWFVINFVIND